MFAAAAMSLSSFCVVTNALRLNFFKTGAKPEKKTKEEKKTMEKTLKIEGMMCGHCEATVKKHSKSCRRSLQPRSATRAARRR